MENEIRTKSGLMRLNGKNDGAESLMNAIEGIRFDCDAHSEPIQSIDFEIGFPFSPLPFLGCNFIPFDSHEERERERGRIFACVARMKTENTLLEPIRDNIILYFWNCVFRFSLFCHCRPTNHGYGSGCGCVCGLLATQPNLPLHLSHIVSTQN